MAQAHSIRRRVPVAAAAAKLVLDMKRPAPGGSEALAPILDFEHFRPATRTKQRSPAKIRGMPRRPRTPEHHSTELFI
jgi:hypothetical protein